MEEEYLVAKKRKNNFLFVVALFFIFLMPSSSLLGGFQLWYLVTLCYILFLASRYPLTFVNSTRGIYIFLYCSFFILVVSLLLAGFNFGSYQDLNEVFRIIGCGLVFYTVFVSFGVDKLKTLDYFFRFFLILELVICFCQGIESINTVIGMLWDVEKVWILRRTGTLANPNILSIFCIVAYSYIYFLNKSKRINLFYFLILCGITLFTSSKTGLLSLIAIMGLNFVLKKGRIKITTLLTASIGIIISMYFLIQLLYLYKDDFPYLAQLLGVFDSSEGTDGIRSLNSRHLMWERSFNFAENFNILQKFFGSGPAKDTVLYTIDNEFITILIKMGYLGACLYVVFILYLLFIGFKNKMLLGGKLLLSVVVTFLLTSYTASTFLAWYLSFLLFFIIAICFKSIKLKI